MKSYNNLLKKIKSFENLCDAFYKARKGKSDRPEILSFFFNLEKRLFYLQEELALDKYETGKYRVFTIFEPKKRVIKAVSFKDRIVHHALCNIIEPIFESRFIFDSFACRKDKGTHTGLNRIRDVVQKKFKYKNAYALKCDIKKYFPSVDHGVLKKIIKNKIKDKKVLDIFYEIIDSDSSKFGSDKGIPIGNLTSQLFANIYLNELDQFVKHELRAKHYFRYVDDFLILSESKKELHIYKYKIRKFLKTLKLEMHPSKVNIFKVNDGVDFVGYKVFPNFIRLRKSNIKKFVKRTKRLKRLFLSRDISKMKIKKSIESWIGHSSHADSYKICRLVFKKLVPEFVFVLDRILKK